MNYVLDVLLMGLREGESILVELKCLQEFVWFLLVSDDDCL